MFKSMVIKVFNVVTQWCLLELLLWIAIISIIIAAAVKLT